MHFIERSQLLHAVSWEMQRAIDKHPPYHSAHELLGVLLEEVDEFQREVFTQGNERGSEQMCIELLHVAAVALRGIEDLRLGYKNARGGAGLAPKANASVEG